MRVLRNMMIAASVGVVFVAGSASAQSLDMQQPKGPWQVPRTIRVPTGPWQTPGQVQPAETVRAPGRIDQPRGAWIVPKGIEAVTVEQKQCTRRISVIGDALFDFDKSDLRDDAEQTLSAIGPEIAKAHPHKTTVDGYTDSIGSDAYNDRLSEARARTVRDWLVDHAIIALGSEIKGFGKRNPVAPNTMADGRDNPAGRQKNRRVEIELDTCG